MVHVPVLCTCDECRSVLCVCVMGVGRQCVCDECIVCVCDGCRSVLCACVCVCVMR